MGTVSGENYPISRSGICVVRIQVMMTTTKMVMFTVIKYAPFDVALMLACEMA